MAVSKVLTRSDAAGCPCGSALHRANYPRKPRAIIGPLLAAPPGPGQLRATLIELSRKTWRDPDGLDVHFGVSTIERWYYAARRADDPVAILRQRVRADIGQFPSMTPAVIEALVAQYRQGYSTFGCFLHESLPTL